MPLTAEDLKAFSPFASIKKQQQVRVDMFKITETLVSEAAAMSNGEGDPVEKIAALVKRVDDVESILAKAVTTEGGDLIVTCDEELAKLAKEFEVVKATPAPATQAAPPAPAATDDGASASTDDGASGTEGGSSDDGDDILTKGEDGEFQWPEDMSPSDPPLLRSERLTKGERPIPAQRGARKAMDKYQRARDRAFQRERGGVVKRATK